MMTNFNYPGSCAKFSDPFLTPSNMHVPTDLRDTLDFSLYLFYINPQYRRATIRTISHFVTAITFTGKSGDDNERVKLKKFLEDTLDIYGVMMTMGEEWGAVGNSFWRINYPFTRSLVDKRGGKRVEYALSAFPEASVSFDLQSLKYKVPDPKDANKTVELSFIDRKSKEYSKISLQPLMARNMTIQKSFVSGKMGYIYRFDPDFISDINKGELYQVNETPLEMLRAVKENQDFKFSEDVIFHFKAPTITGISTRGWGIPEPLLNYRPLHQLQVYRKIDEQVGLDYLLPFRLFSPTDMNTEFSHGFQIDAGEWTQHIGTLIKDRRTRPENIHAFPFPVTYQEFGAEGKNLTPKDLIAAQSDELLDGMGYPAELFHGSLQVQQIPTALRMFENSFRFIYAGFNRFLKWTTSNILTYQKIAQIELQLDLPTVADDLEKRGVYLQLAAGGELSRATAYKSFNIQDPVEEARARAREDTAITLAQQKEQETLQKEIERGAINPDEGTAEFEESQEGAPPPQGGGAPSDSLFGSLNTQAEQQAMQLLQIPDDGERAKALTQIRISNPELHAVVKQKMEEMRAQGASEGRKNVAAGM